MRIRGYDENSEDGLEEVSEELENISGDIYDLTRVNGGKGISIFSDKEKTEYKSTYEILKEIAGIWDELTDKQQAQLLEKLGGKRSAQVLSGLLSNFDEVERALDTMEDAAGSSDREMSIIRDSISYKINNLKQTWVGTLQEIADRKDVGNVVDTLTGFSEGLGEIISKLGILKTTLIGIGTVIGTKKLGLFKLLQGDTSGVKNIINSINKISQTGKSITEARIASTALSSLTNVTSGTVEITNLQEYRSILNGLTDEQKVLALSTSQLNAAQAKMVLTYSEADFAETALTEAEANRIITQAGLTASTKALNAEEISSLATKTGLTEMQLTQAMQQAGAIVTKEGDVLITEKLNEAELKQSLISSGVAEANAAETASYVAETAAKSAATAATTKFAGGTNLLIGVLSKLKAVVIAHPILAVLTAITAGVTAFIMHEKKHKEEIEKIVDESVAAYDSATTRLQKGKQTFDESLEEFVELSKGVNSVGNNVSLTTEEYEKYHEIANKLAETTPSLVKAWDDQGNAILRVKDSVEELSEAYKQEVKEANNLIISTGSELIENSTNQLVDNDVYGGEDYSVQERLDKAKKLLKNNIFTKEDIEDFKTQVPDPNDLYGGFIDEYTDLFTMLQSAGIDTSNIDWRDEKSVLNFLNNMSEKDRKAFEAYISKTEAVLSTSLSDRRKLFKAYFQNALLDSNIDSDIQDSLYGLADSINNSVLENLDSEDAILQYVDTVINAFEKLSPYDQEKINEYINLDTMWNDDKLSYDKYVEKVQALIALLEQLFPGDENEQVRKSFMILFDVPDENELEKQQEIFLNRLGEKKVSGTGETNGMPSEVKNRLKSQGLEVADEWYDSLTKSEREFVDNLSDEDLAEAVTFESTEEFDEWLAELQKEANIQIEVDYSSRAIENLDNMQDAFGDLTTAYKASVKNRDSSDKVTNYTASASDIQGVNDAFGGVTFNEKDIENVNALSNALEKYNTTLIENKGDAIAAQDATDELATAYVDQSGILKDLNEENKETYILYLKLNGITNAQEVVESRLSKQAQKTAENLTKLSKAIAQNRKALDKGEEAGTEYDDAIKAISDDVAGLLTLEDDDGEVLFNAAELINDDNTEFVKEHLDDIYAAVEGDIDALNRLRIEIARLKASKLMINLDIPTEAAEGQLNTLMDLVTQADNMDIDIGASIEDESFIRALARMMEATNMTVDDINEVFDSIGFEAEYVRTGTTEIEVPDIDLSKTNGAINSAEDYKKADTGNKKKVKVSNFALTVTRKANKATGAAVNNYSGSTYSDSDSDSGSSSDSDSNDFSESFDWIEKAIDRLEEELDRLDEQVGNTYKNWTSRNEALLEEITKTGDEIKMQADASKKYEELANEVAIPEEYKIKVQAGEMSVEDIDESVVTEALKDYYNDKLDKGELDQEWQDKYKGAKLTDEDFAEMAGINEDEVTEAIRDYWKDQLSKGNGTAEMLEKYNTNTLTDSDYAEILSTYIQDYEDLYDKSVEATDKETELTKTVLDYHKQIFEDIQTQLDEIVSEIDNKVDLIDKRMTRSEEMGYFVNTDYYDQLIDLTQERIDARSYQIEQATQAMNQAVENGMEKNSEEWYEMYNNILEMVGDQEEDITQKIKYENEKRQQLWDRADWIEERMNDYVDEAEFIRGLLDGEKLFEDDGQFTKYGVTNLALLSSEYQANVAEAERYRSQYEALQEDLKKSPGDKNLIERLETIKKGWQDATSAVQDNEKAIQEALKASVDQYLSNLQEIINKYKEALQSSKDLYDWQKNVADQTTNIANLEKQINAYANDDSEEARKTRQELQKQLDEAQQNLEESQWEHYISETGDMLDDMYDKLSDYLEEQTEDMHVIRTLMEEYVNNHETEATEGLTAIESIYNVTSDYFDHVDDGDANTSILTDIKTTLNNIYEGWKFVANPEENGNTNEVEYESSQVVVNDDGTVSISRLNGNAPTGVTEKKGTWKSDDNGYWFEYEDGSYAKNEWKKIDDQDYYFDEDGYMATSQYVDGKSIRPDGTVEDDDYEWKESDGKWWYGSSSENYATGHVKIDGQWHTFDDEGWWLGAYAKGSKSISKTGIGITNEDGSELVWRTDSGALLTPLNQGDMVFTSDMSRRLWEIAKGNIPSGMNITMPSINGSSPQNVTANNNISIELPNVKNYDEFKKAMKNDSEMEKFWQEITVGQMMGNNTLKKNKY